MGGSLREVDIPDNVSLPAFILNKLSGFPPDRVLLVDGTTGREWTCQMIVSLVKKTAASLRFEYNVGKGSIICFMLPNSPEFAILLLGVLSTGATVTTCNPSYTKDELQAQLHDCQPDILITVADNLEKAEKASLGISSIRAIILQEDRPSNIRDDKFRKVQDLFNSFYNRSCPEPVIDARQDTAMMLYSSGTTGRPKGVMLTHFNCISTICMFSLPELQLYHPGAVSLALTPFFHVYGINVVLCVGLCNGAKVVTVPRFHPVSYLECIQKYQATLLFVAPPTVFFLRQSPLVNDYDVSSVRTVFSGGAPLSRKVADDLRERLKIKDVRQGYGMTEASPGILISLPSEEDPHTVGLPMSNTLIKVIDPSTGDSLSQNQVGEICIKGPQVMKGYYKRPESTSEILDKNGWLRSGDLGFYNEDGKFYIVDRLKELIKYNAFQVAPAELEDVLLTHPSIVDAAVMGKPDAAAGELPLAFVVSKDPKLTTQDVLEYVAQRVANYKRLRGGVIFTECVPKSPSGKILRRILRNRISSKL